MFCPNCGAQNADSDSFCAKCGTELPDVLPEGIPLTKRQVAGMACHYPGCTEPVIGQCPGYKGACLRFYCAIHSVGSYCSVCVDRIAKDAAIEKVHQEYLKAAELAVMERIHQDYLKEAESIWEKRLGCLHLLVGWFFFVLIPSLLIAQGKYFWTCQAIGIVGLILVWATSLKVQQDAINTASIGRPGFREFYAEYAKQRRSTATRKA